MKYVISLQIDSIYMIRIEYSLFFSTEIFSPYI